jgi:hypothetical protein
MKKCLLVFVSILLLGCVDASGPFYGAVSQSGSLTGHAGNAMVLIYWPSRLVTGDSDYWIFANDVPLQRLRKAGFYSYEASPGQLDLAFSMAKEKPSAGGAALSLLPLGGGLINYAIWHHRPHLAIDVVAGQTRYVRLVKTSRGPVMQEVSKEESESELQQCHWINAPAQS